MSISIGIGSPGTVGGASGGKQYGFNNIAEGALVTVLQANPSRRRAIFHNPGTVDLFIAPTFVQNVIGTAPTTPSNVAFTPNNSNLGGCFRVYANGGTLTIEGECQGAYQAFAVTGGGSTNPLTVNESNV
jgi:hypothetical protein